MPGLVRALRLLRGGFPSHAPSLRATHPVHSVGSPSLPRPRFTLRESLRCRTIQPACHRLRLLRPRLRTRLTLGRLTVPRNPQAFGGGGSHTTCATHSGIRTSTRSTSRLRLASWHAERSPTSPPASAGGLHGVGGMLEPRYVVGARALDQ